MMDLMNKMLQRPSFQSSQLPINSTNTTTSCQSTSAFINNVDPVRSNGNDSSASLSDVVSPGRSKELNDQVYSSRIFQVFAILNYNIILLLPN